MFRSVLALACLSTAAVAEVPKVVTDIAPIHALVADVMKGVGAPDLLIPAGASPHHHEMRPSEARMLSQADLVVWMGPGLSPWLDNPVETLAAKALDMRLEDVPGTVALENRKGAILGGGHDHGHDDHAQEAHDDHDTHDAAHDDDHDHAHGENHAEDGAHKDEHGHAEHAAGIDPHQWLDAQNATLWLTHIATKLAEQDPENASLYRKNAKDAAVRITQADAQIKSQLAPYRNTPFLLLHDGLQYFEVRYGMQAQAAVSDSEDATPGPARIAELRKELQKGEVHCALVEPLSDQRLLNTVIEGLDVKVVELDLIGVDIVGKSNGYTLLLTTMADNIESCLTH